MRVLIVYNMSAGTNSSSIFLFERELIADGDEVVMRATDGTTEPRDMVADAAEFDAVVVAGGDGTISSSLYAMRDVDVPVLAYPAGTSNLININLNSPIDAVPLAHLTRALETISFDLGELNLEESGVAEDGPESYVQSLSPRRVGFDIIAGAGFDAIIMEQAARYKQVLGPSAYLAAAVANPMPTRAHFTIELDGEVVESDAIAVLLVNFGQVAEGISVTPHNDPRDGLFEVVIIKARTNIELLPVAVNALLERDAESKLVEMHRASSVVVRSDPPLPIQFDGEPTGLLTPFKARVLPGAARLIVTHEQALEASE